MIQFLSQAAFGACQRVVTRGPRHAATWIGHHIYERYRESNLGIDTARFDDWKGSVGNSSCHDYEPLCYRCIEQALARITIDPDKDVFLDYGCGKGRAVISAASLPFRRVIGVDLIEELCVVARDNVRRAQAKLICQSVDIVNADATRFQIPDDVTVIYLYNPFWDEVLREVQSRIHESLERTPRPLRIMYLLNANQYDSFTECAWLDRKTHVPEMWENVQFALYENHNQGY